MAKPNGIATRRTSGLGGLFVCSASSALETSVAMIGAIYYRFVSCLVFLLCFVVMLCFYPNAARCLVSHSVVAVVVCTCLCTSLCVHVCSVCDEFWFFCVFCGSMSVWACVYVAYLELCVVYVCVCVLCYVLGVGRYVLGVVRCVVLHYGVIRCVELRCEEGEPVKKEEEEEWRCQGKV